MTREEAIKHLLHDWHINLGCEFAIKPGRLDDFLAAVDVALTALRGPTREQVEKVFPGCPYCKEDPDGYVQKFGAYSIQGGELTTGHCKPQKINFCPHCSRPLTDEAVDMMMDRWKEATHD